MITLIITLLLFYYQILINIKISYVIKSIIGNKLRNISILLESKSKLKF